MGVVKISLFPVIVLSLHLLYTIFSIFSSIIVKVQMSLIKISLVLANRLNSLHYLYLYPLLFFELWGVDVGHFIDVTLANKVEAMLANAGNVSSRMMDDSAAELFGVF